MDHGALSHTYGISLHRESVPSYFRHCFSVFGIGTMRPVRFVGVRQGSFLPPSLPALSFFWAESHGSGQVGWMDRVAMERIDILSYWLCLC